MRQDPNVFELNDYDIYSQKNRTNITHKRWGEEMQRQKNIGLGLHKTHQLQSRLWWQELRKTKNKIKEPHRQKWTLNSWISVSLQHWQLASSMITYTVRRQLLLLLRFISSWLQAVVRDSHSMRNLRWFGGPVLTRSVERTGRKSLVLGLAKKKLYEAGRKKLMHLGSSNTQATWRRFYC